MTYVSARFAQADPGIVSGSTIERNKMSTKTSFKRIALVAVTALGAGVLSVAPASAAAGVAIATSVPTVGTASQVKAIGATATTTVGFTTAATAAAADDQVYTNTSVIISAPTGSAVTLADRDGAGAGTTAAFGAGSATANLIAAVSTSTGAVTGDANGGDVAGGAVVAGTVTIIPDVEGTYKVTVTSGAGTTAVATIYAADLYVEVADGISNGDESKLTASGVTGPYNNVTVNFNTTASVSRLITVTGSTIVSAAAPTAGTAVISTDKTSVLITDDGTAETVAIVIATPTAGTISVKAFAPAQGGIYSTTAYGTVTITVGTAAQLGTLSVANSTSIIDGTGTLDAGNFNATADETILVPSTASSTTEVAIIKVTLKDTLTGLMPNTTSLSATIAGPGSLGIGATPTAAAGRAVSSVTSSGVVYVTVYADGTSGKSTITLAVGTTTVATETVTFYGAASKYTAVVKKLHVANSGGGTAGAIEVTATDKDGNLVPSAVIGASVGTSTIATVSASATTNSSGVASFTVTGQPTKFGSVVVTFADSATAPTVTTTATIGVSSVLAASVTAAASAASVAPGAAITWTLTFKDANGLGLPDGDYAADALLKNSAANPVASASLASTPFAGNATISLVAGVATAKGFAPLTAGPISYTWTIAGTAGAADTTNLVKALQATTVTASTTVTDSAAMSALTTLINSLIAKINALNKLVIKIQKKVKA